MKLGNHILLLVSERIGDVIFCTPAIHFLHTQHPTAKLSVIASSSAAASVFEYNSDISAIYTAPNKTQLKQLAKEYDTVIDLHNNKYTRHYSAILKLPTFKSPRCEARQHQSSVASKFIASLLNCSPPDSRRYSLHPQLQHFRTVKQLLETANIDLEKDILIGCHMGCSQVARRGFKLWKKTTGHKAWPVDNFITLEKMLREKNPHIRFVLTGTPSETNLCQQLIKHSDRAIDLSGKTSVLDLAALMSYCKIFLTGDTGPLHVACSTPIPIVTLFGPTSADETGPYPHQRHHQVLQQPQIENITVDMVYAALNEVLS